MLRRDHDVLHPGVLGDAHPGIGVEPDGVEAVHELFVVGDGDVRPAHDPFPDPRDALALVGAGGDGVGPPVDEHPEARVAPPGHTRVAGGGTLRTLGLHHHGEQNVVAKRHKPLRRLVVSYRPCRAVRVRILCQTLGLHRDAVAGRRGRQVAAVTHHDGIHEVLVQVIHIFDHAILERGADGDVVEHREVLYVLAQPDTARMRTYRNPELGREQQHRQHLVHAAQPAAIDLTELDRLGLHQLLEDDAVLALLAGRDADRGHRLGDRRVAQHVVRAGRLFDPPGIEPRQLPNPGDGLVHVPDLIGVHHELAIGPDLMAHQCGATHVVLQVPADLDLEVRPAARDALAAQTADLVVGVAKPPGRGGV